MTGLGRQEGLQYFDFCNAALLYRYEGKGKRQQTVPDMCKSVHCAAVSISLQGTLSESPVSLTTHCTYILFRRQNQQHHHGPTNALCYNYF